MNPRKDCEVTPDDHTQDRMIDRGLAYTDLERMVRKGSWRPQSNGTIEVVCRSWTITVMRGGCVLHVMTVKPDRS